MEHYYLIADCDPGIDDSLALLNLVNSNNITVPLISTVSGNMPVEEVTKNALQLVELFKKDIPVVQGASSPITRECVFAVSAQGKKGLGGYQFKKPVRKAIPMDAVDAIHQTLKCNMAANTIILCIGSMTNIANLLIRYPDSKSLIGKIVFMGGSKDEDGSAPPYKEFNIAFDPEAADTVIKSGIQLVMVPMELGHFAYFTFDEIKKIGKANSLGKIYEKMFSKYNDFHVGELGAAVHDSCAALYCTNPEIFKTEPANIKIKFYKDKVDKDYGYVACDFKSKDANALVCVDVDVDTFKKIIYGNIFSYND